MLLWDCDDRNYSYYIEVSNNRKDWEVICDRSKAPCKSWQHISFPRRPIVYIQIVGTHNTANEVFHCVHFECPAVTQVPAQFDDGTHDALAPELADGDVDDDELSDDNENVSVVEDDLGVPVAAASEDFQQGAAAVNVPPAASAAAVASGNGGPNQPEVRMSQKKPRLSLGSGARSSEQPDFQGVDDTLSSHNSRHSSPTSYAGSHSGALGGMGQLQAGIPMGASACSMERARIANNTSTSSIEVEDGVVEAQGAARCPSPIPFRLPSLAGATCGDVSVANLSSDVARAEAANNQSTVEEASMALANMLEIDVNPRRSYQHAVSMRVQPSQPQPQSQPPQQQSLQGLSAAALGGAVPRRRSKNSKPPTNGGDDH